MRGRNEVAEVEKAMKNIRRTEIQDKGKDWHVHEDKVPARGIRQGG